MIGSMVFLICERGAALPAWFLLPASALLAWAIGGIPWGVLLVRWTKGVDLRRVGSGNTGATNAARAMESRAGGLALFALVYLLDLTKAPAAFAPLFLVPPPAGMTPLLEGTFSALLGLAVILGHCFSPWLGLRGGKGVATTCGVLLMLDWLLLPLGLAVFFLVFLAFRMVSLGSICLGLSLPLFWLLIEPAPLAGAALPPFLFLLLLALLILLRHRSNLVRIAAGRERKVGLFSRAPR